MPSLKEEASNHCKSFKGGSKSKCVENYIRNITQGSKRREQGREDDARYRGEYEKKLKSEKRKEKKYGKAGAKALKVIENKKKYGKKWTKRGAKGSRFERIRKDQY